MRATELWQRHGGHSAFWAALHLQIAARSMPSSASGIRSWTQAEDNLTDGAVYHQRSAVTLRTTLQQGDTTLGVNPNADGIITI